MTKRCPECGFQTGHSRYCPMVRISRVLDIAGVPRQSVEEQNNQLREALERITSVSHLLSCCKIDRNAVAHNEEIERVAKEALAEVQNDN